MATMMTMTTMMTRIALPTTIKLTGATTVLVPHRAKLSPPPPSPAAGLPAPSANKPTFVPLNVTNAPMYVLIPVCGQFCYAYGDSPYANFSAFLPVCTRGVPICIRGSVCDVSAIFPPVTHCTGILCMHARTLTSKIITTVLHYFDSITPHLCSGISHSHSPFVISLTSDFIILCC